MRDVLRQFAVRRAVEQDRPLSLRTKGVRPAICIVSFSFSIRDSAGQGQASVAPKGARGHFDAGALLAPLVFAAVHQSQHAAHDLHLKADRDDGA